MCLRDFACCISLASFLMSRDYWVGFIFKQDSKLSYINWFLSLHLKNVVLNGDWNRRGRKKLMGNMFFFLKISMSSKLLIFSFFQSFSSVHFECDDRMNFTPSPSSWVYYKLQFGVPSYFIWQIQNLVSSWICRGIEKGCLSLQVWDGTRLRLRIISRNKFKHVNIYFAFLYNK